MSSSIKEVLLNAQSDADRERISYAVSKSFGKRITKLRQIYGFRTWKVEWQK